MPRKRVSRVSRERCVSYRSRASLYKIVLSTYVYQMLLALNNTDIVVYSIKYVYLYTCICFWLFRLQSNGRWSSNILGIQTPMNFNIPSWVLISKISGPDGISPCRPGWGRFCIFQEYDAGYQGKMVKNRLHNATYAYDGQYVGHGFSA